jgi:hypothetical protein
LNLKGLLKSTTIADKILLSTLILLSFSGIVFIKEVLPKGKIVQIEVDSRPVYILPIDKDRTVSVEGPVGKTVVEIRNHRVRVTESPCQNKLCIKQGWIESGAIICLPNRVVVTIGNQEEKSDKIVDAITG